MKQCVHVRLHGAHDLKPEVVEVAEIHHRQFDVFHSSFGARVDAPFRDAKSIMRPPLLCNFALIR